jgi:ATP-dependent DNA helicase RecG
MMRPEALFPLFAGLETLPGVGPKAAEAFKALGVERPKDLLYVLPHSGIDRARRASVRDVVPPATLTVEVEVGMHVPPRTKGRPYRVHVRDESSWSSSWFSSTPVRTTCKSCCRPGRGGSSRARWSSSTASPRWCIPTTSAAGGGGRDLPAYEPVYPLAAGLTQRMVAKAVPGR